MNRLVRGSVILAAVAMVGACGGLDTDGIDQTAELVADPTVIFVNNTDSQAVFVEALNSLGQQLEGNFTISNVGAGLVVNEDTAFAPRPGVGELPTRVRYFVRPTDPATFVSSTFTITANGQSITIPVNVTPANLPGTFSNAAPNVGDTVTFTPAAPLKVTPNTQVTFNGVPSLIISTAADSSSISFLPPPGANTAAVVTGISVSYLSALQTLTTTELIGVTSTSNYTGVDDPTTTAPEIAAPTAVGDTTEIYDLSQAVDAYYAFTITTPGTYRMVISWPGTGLAPDIDGGIVNPTLTAYTCGAGTAALPETCAAALVAATYWVNVFLYDGAAPAWVRIRLIRES